MPNLATATAKAPPKTRRDARAKRRPKRAPLRRGRAGAEEGSLCQPCQKIAHAARVCHMMKHDCGCQPRCHSANQWLKSRRQIQTMLEALVFGSWYHDMKSGKAIAVYNRLRGQPLWKLLGADKG